MDLFTTEIDSDKPGLLKQVAEMLHQHGYVKEGYLQALLKREQEWPTGLTIEGGMNIAIPHTDVEFVKKDAVLIVKNPSSHYLFQKMDAPDETIAVQIAVFFVLKEGKNYVTFLSELISALQSPDCYEVLTTAETKTLAKFLTSRLNKFNLNYQGQLTIANESN